MTRQVTNVNLHQMEHYCLKLFPVPSCQKSPQGYPYIAPAIKIQQKQTDKQTIKTHYFCIVIYINFIGV
jgi:hypothetical protein